MVKIRVQDNDEGYSATEIFKKALQVTHTSHSRIAGLLGWSRQSLAQKVTRRTLRADEFLKALALLGVEPVFVDKQTGRDIFAPQEGCGGHFRGNADGVTYDTATSKLISSSFFRNGSRYTDGLASELYIDRNGRYFRVDYYEDAERRTRARAVTGEGAARFIEENGTSIVHAPAL